MEIRASYLLVGAVVLALFAGLAAFSVWLVRADVDQTTVPYRIAFEGSVTGLQDGSPVRYRGVPVGRVSDIRIDPANVEQILVDVEIEQQTPVKENTVATLEMQGVTGIAFVQLRGGTQDSPPLEAETEDQPPRIPSRRSALERVFETTPDLLARGIIVMEKFSAVLDEQNVAALSGTLQNLETFTEVLADRSEQIETLIGDASGAASELNELVGDIHRLTARIEDDFGGVGGEVVTTMEELRTAANALAGAANELEAALSVTRQPLGDFAESGLYEFSQLVGETRRLVAALTRITKEFERDPTGFLLGSSQGFETE